MTASCVFSKKKNEKRTCVLYMEGTQFFCVLCNRKLAIDDIVDLACMLFIDYDMASAAAAAG